MEEYLKWLTDFEYLEVIAWQTMVFYFFLALFFWLVRFIFYLKYIHIANEKDMEDRYKTHGRVANPGTFIGLFLLAISLGPFCEEIVFRGPVLWFVLRSQYAYAFLVLFLTSAFFMIAHLAETRGKYADGTFVRYSKPAIYSVGIGGIFYGILVIITGSLWPSIFLHLLWNLLTTLLSIFYEDRINKLAYSLQR
ncbi:MAG: CPBP family intramembrane metalloprotease [Candidatus Yanofskybacteria bacterium]|nr:CPBP family intramembrane metalloprotease [Candidatus Yanofskybacteria bacterium]